MRLRLSHETGGDAQAKRLPRLAQRLSFLSSHPLNVPLASLLGKFLTPRAIKAPFERKSMR